MKQMKDERYNLIRFALTWIIFIHHVLTSARDSGVPRPYVLNGLFSRVGIGFGMVAVSMFFMLSGALLWKNHRTIGNYAIYYRNRLVKLLVPIWICSVPLILCEYMMNPGWVTSEYARKTFLFNFLGLDLYTWILKDFYPFSVTGEWFTSVILTMYIIYPLLRIAFRNKTGRFISTILITVIFFLNTKYKIMTMGNGWYSFTVGLFYFWIGMLFEEYSDRLDSNRWALAAFLIFAVDYIIINGSLFNSPFIPVVIATISAFTVLFRMSTLFRSILSKPVIAAVIKETCSTSYLIYLCHHHMIRWFLPFMLNENSNTFQFYIFIAFIAALTYGYTKMVLPAVNFSISKLTRKTSAAG